MEEIGGGGEVSYFTRDSLRGNVQDHKAHRS